MPFPLATGATGDVVDHGLPAIRQLWDTPLSPENFPSLGAAGGTFLPSEPSTRLSRLY